MSGSLLVMVVGYYRGQPCCSTERSLVNFAMLHGTEKKAAKILAKQLRCASPFDKCDRIEVRRGDEVLAKLDGAAKVEARHG